MSYQSGPTLYRSYQDAVEGICEDWLTAMQQHDARTAIGLMADTTPEQAATEMTAEGWNTLTDTEEQTLSDDGEYEDARVVVDHDDLVAGIKAVLERLAEQVTEEEAAEAREVQKKYTITVGETLVGETDDRDEAQALLSEARDMSRRHANHYSQPIGLTEDGRTVDLTGPEGFDW